MPYPEVIRKHVLEALRATGGMSVQAIANAYGMHHQTVTRWARAAKIKLPPAHTRMVAGGQEGTARLWGDWRTRREKARTMKATGATLRQIRETLGYKSPGGAHYAVK
jgi:transposase-like protein